MLISAGHRNGNTCWICYIKPSYHFTAHTYLYECPVNRVTDKSNWRLYYVWEETANIYLAQTQRSF